MDFERRRARVSKLDHIINEKIQKIMKVDHDILTTIEKKRLVWYGHIQRMGEERWPKKVLTELGPSRTTKKRETTKKLQGRNPTDDGG